MMTARTAVLLAALFFSPLLPTAHPLLAAEKTINIKEKMFAGQIDDIYLNNKEYEGKTVNIAGMYMPLEIRGKKSQLIYRYGPGGCCGNDALVGILFEWSGALPKKEGAWIEITGKIKIVKYGAENEIVIAASSLHSIKPQKAYIK